MITNFVLCYFFMPNPKFRNLNFKWRRKQIDKIKELFEIYTARRKRGFGYILFCSANAFYYICAL